MKLVREYINEAFQKNSDPISDMGIGRNQIFKKMMGNDYSNDTYSLRKPEKVEIAVKFLKAGIFSTKKEAVEKMLCIFGFIKSSWHDHPWDNPLFDFIKENNPYAEDIIELLYVLDSYYLKKIIELILQTKNERLYNICLKKYKKHFIHYAMEIGTHISGIGWRDQPIWHNKIIAKELLKSGYLKIKETQIKKDIQEKLDEIAFIKELQTKTDFNDAEVEKMAMYNEQYKKYKQENQ